MPAFYRLNVLSTKVPSGNIAHHERCREVFGLVGDGGDEEVATLLRSLVEAGAPVKSFHQRKADVEELFLAVEAGEE